MKQFCRWFLLFCKRLYRSFAFWGVILLMIVVSLTFSYITKTEPAIARVILVQQNPEDSVTKNIVSTLLESRETISFVLENDVNRAKDQILHGKADAVWIFPQYMSDALQTYSEGEDPQSKIVIFQREDTVILRLARERLSAAVYQCSARYVYLRFLQEKAPNSQKVSNEELLKYWHETSVSGELFSFTDIQGTPESSDNALIQTYRGLLAILGTMLLLIVSLRFQKDLDTGKFAAIPQKNCILAEFCYLLAAGLHYGLAMQIVVCISNAAFFSIEEAFCVFVFIFSITAFSMLLRSILGGKRRLMVFLPALAVILLLFCSGFASFPFQHILKWLFPPTYYTLSLRDVSTVWYGLLYSILVFAFALALRFVKLYFSRAVSN